MFTPSKSKTTATDVFDGTLLNTPQPQATSTVQRKSTLERQYINHDINKDKYKQSDVPKGDVTQKTDSSLGILDDISSFLAEVGEMGDTNKLNESKMDAERELARKLLQRCSDFKTTSVTYDVNKENNANIQNLTSNVTHSTFDDQDQSVHSNQFNSQQNTTLKHSIDKVVFEPNEITARSSGLSRSSENCLSSSSNKNPNIISFDATTADLMAQFNNEEFRPASQMGSQLLADEASWQQNYSYAFPATSSAEKEYLNLSCFSGIIGELDLSVESCAGRKMSVDEFFRRKCGGIGDLSHDAIERPSIGLSVSSPTKKRELMPLVDTTMMTEASSIASCAPKSKTDQIIPNVTKDIGEQSIMSLSSIAQALKDIDNGTPRRLVDQLIMATKKRKPMQDVNVTTETYVLPSSHRKSMPATPSSQIEKFEKDISLNIPTKLSLGSKILNETVDVKPTIPRMLSFESNNATKTRESFLNACRELEKEVKNGSLASSYNKDFPALDVTDTSFTYCKADKDLSSRTSVLAAKLIQDQKLTDLGNQREVKKQPVKEENISYKDSSHSITSGSLDLQLNGDVVIGRSTEELCNCIVGVLRETDIEILNRGDRWVICSLNLNQIQGDKESVQLKLPKDVILIKPKSAQHPKIGVKVVKMCKPIIAILNITVSDMVTRSESTMKHIICFKPEEFNMYIPCLSETEELNFQSIVENSKKILPITLENRNNITVPMKFSIVQDEPAVFGIENSNELQSLTLKSQQAATIKIECNGLLPKNAKTRKLLYCYKGKLMIQTENNVDGTITIREIPLVVQVGICKIQVIDTDSPLIVSDKHSKPLTIVNHGSMNVTISASFIQDTLSTKPMEDFAAQPENLVLLPNETGCFLITYKAQNFDTSKKQAKIKLAVDNNIYYYSIIGELSDDAEENDNFPRCGTPQYLSSVSSPTSPHSVSTNRSGFSGRNSPSSSVSGSIVTGDKIPIRATHAALVWNSVKTGKSEIKEFTICNTSNNKIKIQALILDNEKSFRFLRERQSVGSSLVLVLQRSESRTLSVVFSPHHLGAAAGKINFMHYESKREGNESRPSKVIFLYGYGGYGKVEISEAFKDISGKMWLSLGTFNSGDSLRGKFKLKNTGELCSYAKIKLTPKAVYPTMVSSWHVNPTELLLLPNESQWVTLEFRPRKEDLALKRSDVSHVGTVTVIHGDEPTRWRIRRLYNKIKETGELSGNENEAFRNIVHPICKAFPGEQLLTDLNVIRDTVQDLGALCRGVLQHEIMLTMEVCADDTLSVLQDNANDSQMFYSLCSDDSHVYEGSGDSFLPSETLGAHYAFQRELHDDNFEVTPCVVHLNPPITREAIVTIRSFCMVAQPFETSLSNTEYLSVVPAEGMIPTRRGFELKIQCKHKIQRNFNAVLEIYTENNKQNVEIRVTVKR